MSSEREKKLIFFIATTKIEIDYVHPSESERKREREKERERERKRGFFVATTEIETRGSDKRDEYIVCCKIIAFVANIFSKTKIFRNGLFRTKSFRNDFLSQIESFREESFRKKKLTS
jgi:hypothetical protein